MPKFPSYQREQGLGGGSTASYASDGAFTAPARALAGLGGAIADVGQNFQAETDKIRATQDEAWFSKARAQTSVDMIAAEREAQQSATGEASSYMDDIGGRFKTYRDTKLTEAPSPRAQQLYTQWADGFGVGVTERASNFQAGSELAKRADDFSQAMNAHQQAIFADPEQFDTVYQRAMDDFEGAKRWMTPEQEVKAKEVTDRNLKLAWAKKLASVDPERFLTEIGVRGGKETGGGGGISSVVNRIVGAESGGDPNAQNSRSSASGLGQFVDSTWVATVRKHRPDIAKGMSNDQIIELKSDAALGREMTTRHTEENAKGLASAGVPVTDGNVYLAHFAGLQGAKNILTAPDDTPVADVLDAAAIKANPTVLGGGKTVADVKAWASQKMGTGSAPKSAGGPVPNVTFIDETGGKIRSKPVQGWVRDGIARAAFATDPGLSIKIVSGGQNPLGVGGARTGSTRHDHGNAADIVLMRDGKPVLPSQDKALYAAFFKNAAANGFKGLGHYEWGIHVGGGAQAAWGPDKSSRTLDPEFAKAAAEGWGNPAAGGIPEEGGAPQFVQNPRLAGLSADDLMSLQNDAERTVATQKSTEYASLKDQYQLAIATNQITSENQIIGSGLNGGDVASLLGTFRSAQKEERSLTQAWSGFSTNSLELDSYEAKDRTTIDKMEESILRGSAPAGGQSAAPASVGGGAAPAGGSLTIGGVSIPLGPSSQGGVAPNAGAFREAWVNETVKRYGIVPKATLSEINRGLESPKPAEFAAAAARASQINTLDPAALGKRENGSKAAEAATMFEHLVIDRGMTQEAAAQKMLSLKDPVVKANREVLKPNLEKFTKTLTVGDVTNAFDSVFSSEPGAGIMPIQQNAMLAEYREVAEEAFYEAGGDAGLAKALAVKEMAKRWNVSNISGSPQIMRMPPEQYYPPVGGKHDYLRADAMQTAESYVSDTFPERKVDNVAIIPGKMTREDIEKGRPPRYRLFYQYEEDGQQRFDEVFAGAWGLPTEDINAAKEAAKAEFVRGWEQEGRANDAALQGDAAAEKALDETVGPDWMKARGAEAERERGKMKADEIRRSGEPDAKPKDKKEPPPAEDAPSSLFMGAP